MNYKAIFAALFFSFSTPSIACDSLILTGLDVSSSVGVDGLSVEMEGMATAISSSKVVDVIMRGQQKCIYFAAFLWTDELIVPIIPWIKIASQEDAGLVALMIKKKIPEAIEVMQNKSSLTDISEALEEANRWFKAAPHAPRKVLNIAGDGEDNSGETPTRARAILRNQGIIINGVVFPSRLSNNKKDVINLANYYRREVTGGPGSFVYMVELPEDFERAFINKFRLDIVRQTD